MEEIRDTKAVLESQGNVHDKLRKQANSEFQSFTSNPIRSPEPSHLQSNTQIASDLRFGCSTHAQ
jgi:hypothetical protein